MLVKSMLRNVQQLYKKRGLFKKANLNKPSILVVAHRGASGYAPENTMVAFKKALELKADFIELDVQMTKDNVLVVIHDSNVARTTNGTGEVREFSYKELKMLDTGLWFNRKFSGQRIPTLQEVITEFRGKMGLLIEIKNPDLYPTIAESLASELKKNNLDCPRNDEVIVQSFDFELLQRFHQIVPNVPLGLLVKYRVHGISNVQLREWSSLVRYINPNKALITKGLVKRIHSYKLKVIPYTVRDKKSIKGLIDAKVDGVVTDYPDYLKE
ncbi:glycerophosphodiester phosphodiesterase [Metabacillus litoralis]|jgi:glycerophosphoryl diester phosphodiesterase|uniref:glycerophosphodiester phosphodiesterase n=1 Tax=Metabacillus litoralis TaxID=152268 RepID=UPI00203E94B8|nr:glycerophosphodiester phosphodiesterase family protein [Metabacillus litoralis]MCM3651938.1 glycerophosphodiester phosphodiesterase [Metabacillus litoralis]